MESVALVVSLMCLLLGQLLSLGKPTSGSVLTVTILVCTLTVRPARSAPPSMAAHIHTHSSLTRFPTPAPLL